MSRRTLTAAEAAWAVALLMGGGQNSFPEFQTNSSVARGISSSVCNLMACEGGCVGFRSLVSTRGVRTLLSPPLGREGTLWGRGGGCTPGAVRPPSLRPRLPRRGPGLPKACLQLSELSHTAASSYTQGLFALKPIRIRSN